MDLIAFDGDTSKFKRFKKTLTRFIEKLKKKEN